MASVLAIDQGTTGTKAVILHEDGHVVEAGAAEHRQIYPSAGRVEHDPQELLESVASCLALAGSEVAAAGIDNQGETVVAWDAESGEPVCNALVWQDRRTAAEVERLRRDGAEALTLARAGLPLDPYFSATKLRWILDNVDRARELRRAGKLRMGTTDAYFLDRLCGRFITDVSTASRTSLMNLTTLEWDEELCALFGVPIEVLPEIASTTASFGEAHIDGRPIPVTASVVDQAAALAGHGCQGTGDAKVTFGTGAFALAIAGNAALADPSSGLVPTVAWRLAGDRPVYALDGGVFNAASAVNWARGLGLFDDYAEIDAFEGAPAIERDLAFVPALSGLACPYWDSRAAGMWLGMGLDTTSADLCRAVLEGVALRSAQVVTAMTGLVPLADRVSIDGGLSNNAYFRRFLANACGCEIVIPASAELTALGTARLAMLGAGMARDFDELPPLPAPLRVVEPESPGRGETWRVRFEAAVERCRQWRA